MVNNRAKEISLMAVMSLKEDLQTRSLPNITNSIESFVILYFPQCGPTIWLTPRTKVTRTSPAKMLPARVILKVSLSCPIPISQMTYSAKDFGDSALIYICKNN